MDIFKLNNPPYIGYVVERITMDTLKSILSSGEIDELLDVGYFFRPNLGKQIRFVIYDRLLHNYSGNFHDESKNRLLGSIDKAIMIEKLQLFLAS